MDQSSDEIKRLIVECHEWRAFGQAANTVLADKPELIAAINAERERVIASKAAEPAVIVPDPLDHPSDHPSEA